MNTLDKYVYLYSKLYNRKGIHPYFFTPARRIIRKLARISISNYFLSNPIIVSSQKSNVIVSLTSFPARINDVHHVIQCMLRQTISPAKIILWLSKEQFNGVPLPDNLKNLEGDVFNIRFVDGDIKSHKKYFYVLSEYSNNNILIIDDDLYYPTDLIEKMLNALKTHPNHIICRYGSIALFKNNKILPYNKWWNEVAGKCYNQNFFFGSGGGILLKREMLYHEVLNIELAQKLTPLADDIWLNAMINLANTPKFKIYSGLILQTTENQEYRLTSENVYNDKNTEQLYKIIDYFKRINNINPFVDRNYS